MIDEYITVVPRKGKLILWAEQGSLKCMSNVSFNLSESYFFLLDHSSGVPIIESFFIQMLKMIKCITDIQTNLVCNNPSSMFDNL